MDQVCFVSAPVSNRLCNSFICCRWGNSAIFPGDMVEVDSLVVYLLTLIAGMKWLIWPILWTLPPCRYHISLWILSYQWTWGRGWLIHTAVSANINHFPPQSILYGCVDVPCLTRSFVFKPSILSRFSRRADPFLRRLCLHFSLSGSSESLGTLCDFFDGSDVHHTTVCSYNPRQSYLRSLSLCIHTLSELSCILTQNQDLG